jgi:hypothetical protein
MVACFRLQHHIAVDWRAWNTSAGRKEKTMSKTMKFVLPGIMLAIAALAYLKG